jgi:ATP-dependent Lhr-like helicase
MLAVVGDEDYPYLSQPAREVLTARRAETRGVVEPEIGGIELDRAEIRWWTYAGGAVNSTLRYALRYLQADWTITTDNVLVRLRGDDVGGHAFSDALGALGQEGFWDNEQLWTEIAETLPSYRLSKFQTLMPPWMERETLAHYLLDIPGTKAWLGRSKGLLR